MWMCGKLCHVAGIALSASGLGEESISGCRDAEQTKGLSASAEFKPRSWRLRCNLQEECGQRRGRRPLRVRSRPTPQPYAPHVPPQAFVRFGRSMLPAPSDGRFVSTEQRLKSYELVFDARKKTNMKGSAYRKNIQNKSHREPARLNHIYERDETACQKTTR